MASEHKANPSPDVSEVNVADGVRIVEVSGEVDIATAGALEENLERAADGAVRLLVSLVDCRYIDSSGLRVLVRLSNELGENFGVIVPPGTQTRRIFDITGLAYQMDIFDSVSDALGTAHGS